MGVAENLKSRSAGFSLWFHLPRCDFGTSFGEPQPYRDLQPRNRRLIFLAVCFEPANISDTLKNCTIFTCRRPFAQEYFAFFLVGLKETYHCYVHLLKNIVFLSLLPDIFFPGSVEAKNGSRWSVARVARPPEPWDCWGFGLETFRHSRPGQAQVSQNQNPGIGEG